MDEVIDQRERGQRARGLPRPIEERLRNPLVTSTDSGLRISSTETFASNQEEERPGCRGLQNVAAIPQWVWASPTSWFPAHASCSRAQAKLRDGSEYSPRHGCVTIRRNTRDITYHNGKLVSTCQRRIVCRMWNRRVSDVQVMASSKALEPAPLIELVSVSAMIELASGDGSP
jgi:hypothetical protein